MQVQAALQELPPARMPIVDSDSDLSNLSGISDDAPNQLIDLVQSYDWAGALARIAAFPSEVHGQGAEGRTPLHLACENDAPAVVVQALLKAHPSASIEVGTSNMTPLHIACSSSNASVHVVRMLLELGDPQQARLRDVDGDTPLHAACRCGASLPVLEVLLRNNPAAVHERDFEGLTPLLRLWVRYFVVLGNDAVESVRGPGDVTGAIGQAWKKTELLLKCAHKGSLLQEEMGFRAVHAAAAVDCPRPVVKMAVHVYPHQLSEKDENGLTPLLIACQARVFKVRDLSDEGYALEDIVHGDEDEVYGMGSFEQSDDAGQQPSVIEILLNANQADATAMACVPDPLGRLPLHIALETGKKWNEGVRDLIEVYPDSLTTPDPTNTLWPALVAAEGDRVDLGTVFEVLRADPSFLPGATR